MFEQEVPATSVYGELLKNTEMQLVSQTQSNTAPATPVNAANPDNLFQLFPKLPVELKLIIWKLGCRTRREIPRTFPAIPAVLHACTQSREVAEKFYTPVISLGIMKAPREPEPEVVEEEKVDQDTKSESKAAWVVENKSSYNIGSQPKVLRRWVNSIGSKLCYINFDVDHITWSELSCLSCCGDNTALQINYNALPTIHRLKFEIEAPVCLRRARTLLCRYLENHPAKAMQVQALNFVPCHKVFEKHTQGPLVEPQFWKELSLAFERFWMEAKKVKETRLSQGAQINVLEDFGGLLVEHVLFSRKFEIGPLFGE